MMSFNFRISCLLLFHCINNLNRMNHTSSTICFAPRKSLRTSLSFTARIVLCMVIIHTAGCGHQPSRIRFCERIDSTNQPFHESTRFTKGVISAIVELDSPLHTDKVEMSILHLHHGTVSNYGNTILVSIQPEVNRFTLEEKFSFDSTGRYRVIIRTFTGHPVVSGELDIVDTLP